MKKKLYLIVALVGSVLWGWWEEGDAQEYFYSEKTVRIVVATSPGGGFDTYTRTIVRHLGRHLPGNPTMVVENMPGAGHIIGANHLYRVAKPDGLTLGHFQGGLFPQQLLGRPGIEFDARRFEYVGAPGVDTPACAFTKSSGITSIDKWLGATLPVKLGGTGAGAPDDIPRILAATIKLPVQLITGFKGTSEIRLAAESGEIAGGCWTWESMRATWVRAIQNGDAIVVLQILAKPHPELPQVPLARNLAKTEEARELIQAGIEEPSRYYRPYVVPPGTPRERVGLLRKAFQQTMKDPEFIADAKKAKLDIDPVTGEELEELIARWFRLKPSLITKFKELLK
jgi:tripartite-type tricarboxylate transporter receptor subunit TctC